MKKKQFPLHSINDFMSLSNGDLIVNIPLSRQGTEIPDSWLVISEPKQLTGNVPKVLVKSGKPTKGIIDLPFFMIFTSENLINIEGKAVISLVDNNFHPMIEKEEMAEV